MKKRENSTTFGSVIIDFDTNLYDNGMPVVVTCFTRVYKSKIEKTK